MKEKTRNNSTTVRISIILKGQGTDAEERKLQVYWAEKKENQTTVVKVPRGKKQEKSPSRVGFIKKNCQGGSGKKPPLQKEEDTE